MSSVADKYLLMGIANGAKLHFPSASFCCCFCSSSPSSSSSSSVVPVLLAPPISKRLMTFQSVTGPDRCEADVNPCQIEILLCAGYCKGGGRGEKRSLVTLFFTALCVSAAGCELCPPVYVVWECARPLGGNAGAITHARRPQAALRPLATAPDATV